MAEKKRLTIEHLEIDLEAKTTEGEMEAIDYTLRVKTTATDQELEKCLELTEKVCPVGRLFHRAGVPFTLSLIHIFSPLLQDRWSGVPVEGEL